MEFEAKWIRSRVRRAFAARLSGLWMIAPAAWFSACGAGDPATGDGASALSDPQPLSAAANCDEIEADLRAAERRIKAILVQLETTPPGPEKDRLLEELKDWVARANQLRTQLDRCRNPPPPLPNLVAQNIIMNHHPDGTAIDAALFVSNIGQGDVTVPFSIVFGVTTAGIFRQATYRITTPVPSVTAFVTDFITNIPAIRDAQGTATFRFDALVDSNHEVAETSEVTNALTEIRHDTVPPPPPGPVQCPNGSLCCAPVLGGCASLGDCAPPGGSCN